jgi:hypothetical protein
LVSCPQDNDNIARSTLALETLVTFSARHILIYGKRIELFYFISLFIFNPAQSAAAGIRSSCLDAKIQPQLENIDFAQLQTLLICLKSAFNHHLQQILSLP